MKVSYQSIVFFKNLLDYVQSCNSAYIENRSKNDYILFFIKVKANNKVQCITITLENNKDSNIEFLFLKSEETSDRLLIVNKFAKSFSIIHDIIAICSERTMSAWMMENKVLDIL